MDPKPSASPDTVAPSKTRAKSSDQYDSSKDKLEVSDEDNDTNRAVNNVSAFPACTLPTDATAASKLLRLKRSEPTVAADQPSTDTSEHPPAKENQPEAVSAKAATKTEYSKRIEIANKVSKLESETKKHSRSIIGLKKGVEQANTKIASLEQTVASQARELVSMKQSKDQIKLEIEHLKSELERLKEAKGDKQSDLAQNYFSNCFTEINSLKGGLDYLMGAYNSVLRRVSHLELERQHEPYWRR